MKTTLLSVYLSHLKNQGGIYRHQGKEGQGDNPWPKAGARPRTYGRGNVAQARFLWLF